jgi:hypothetical protein
LVERPAVMRTRTAARTADSNCCSNCSNFRLKLFDCCERMPNTTLTRTHTHTCTHIHTNTNNTITNTNTNTNTNMERTDGGSSGARGPACAVVVVLAHVARSLELAIHRAARVPDHGPWRALVPATSPTTHRTTEHPNIPTFQHPNTSNSTRGFGRARRQRHGMAMCAATGAGRRKTHPASRLILHSEVQHEYSPQSAPQSHSSSPSVTPSPQLCPASRKHTGRRKRTTRAIWAREHGEKIRLLASEPSVAAAYMMKLPTVWVKGYKKGWVSGVWGVVLI